MRPWQDMGTLYSLMTFSLAALVTPRWAANSGVALA